MKIQNNYYFLKFAFYVSLVILFSLNILTRVENFPDFLNYSYMIYDGVYWELYFYREPFSALLMWLVKGGEDSGYYYYLIIWLINLFSIFYIVSIHYRKTWILTSFFLIFNPLHIIAFQVPRHFMGMVLFLFVLHSSGLRRLLIVFSAFLFQNVIGAYFAAFVFLKDLSKFKIFLASLLIFVVYLYAASQFFESHLDDDTTRGRGQLLYMLSIFFIYCFITWRRREDWKMLFGLTFLTIALYSFSPVAYRFFEVVSTFAFLRVLNTKSAFFHRNLLRFFVFFSVIASFFIINFGLLGY